MKLITRIAAVFLGFVFIFSGFVKAVDPLGTVYKLNDYFGFLNLGFLSSTSLLFAVGLITYEFITGIMLIFNIKPKTALIMAFLLMVIFTPLTLVLAIKNPISDCGCFGDAIYLTNWQTFYKNLVILALLLFIWFKRKLLYQSELEKNTGIYFWTALSFILLFQLYNLLYLPVFDFRPYKTGVDINQELNKAHNEQFKTILVYRNKVSGELKEFDEENIPWQDSNWVWVETKTIKLGKTHRQGIHDFYITTLDGEDITDSILHIKQPVLLIIAYDVNQTNIKGFNKAVRFAKQFTARYYPVAYCLTASSSAEISNLCKYADCRQIQFCTADATTLKTIIRANPGIVILQNGKIIYKKSFRSKLDIEKFQKN